MGRMEKSIRNTFFSIINSAVGFLAIIISRVVFLKVLNTEYLGVNTLFTEILSVLSISDLGVGSVMLYTFFRPLADKDEDKLQCLVAFYKKLYHIIALAVFVLGVALFPFLPYIVSVETEIKELNLCYLIFLANTVISYLFVYKITLVNADQNNYILIKISLFWKIVCVTFQIILLVLTKNYILYLVIELMRTALVNLSQSWMANRLYPFLKAKKKSALPEQEKKEIISCIKAGFIYKISGIFMNSTDNTLISVLIDTATVGLLNNYAFITTQIGNISTMIFQNLIGSIGNLIATEDPKKRREIFWVLHSISSIISEVAIVCIILLMENFISLWIGSEFILPRSVLVALCCNVYFSISLVPLWQYRDATGMFKKIKYIMLFCGILNLALSIITGKIWGLAGIIASSAVSRLLTYFWYEPHILFKDFFDAKPTGYYFSHAVNVIGIIIVSGILSYPFGKIAPDGWLAMLGKTILAGMVTVCMFLAYNFAQKSFRQSMQYLIKSIKVELKKKSQKWRKKDDRTN